MGGRFPGGFFRNLLIALITSLLAVPLHLVAAQPRRNGETTHLTQDQAGSPYQEALLSAAKADPQVAEALAEMEEVIAELEQADEHTYPQDIPDPFHLTRQYLLVMRKGGNVSDRYPLTGIEGGLPQIVTQPNVVKVLDFNGFLGFRYKRGVHAIESIKPAVIAYDMELLVVIDTAGEMYAIDLSFARKEAFKAPLPVHKLALALTKEEELDGLQMDFVTRGFKPFSHKLGVDGKLLNISSNRDFFAGDLVLWQEFNGQRVLVDVIERDYVITEINNGNFLLGNLAQALRSDKPREINSAIDREEGRHTIDQEKFASYRKGASAKAEQTLQNMDAKRMQRMILNDVAMNSYRDRFTYTRWQRDYLIIRNQAEITIKELEESVSKKYKIVKDLTAQNQLDSLKKQLRKGDFANSWAMLSKLYVDDIKDLVIDRINTLKTLKTPEANAKVDELESIIQDHDYERLWNEPQLINDIGISGLSPFQTKIKRFLYKHMSGDDLKRMANTALGLITVGAAGVGAAWALKTGFSLKGIKPDAFKLKNLPLRPELRDELINNRYNWIRVGYRRHLVWAILMGVALIPAVAVVSYLSARATGQEWDFRKQLTMFGMRAYATLALPFWHYLSRWTGQSTLMPAMAAQVSPMAKVDGESVIGESIGLRRDESIRPGFKNPFTKDDENAEAVRRRAISALQQQRVRAQGLGWEMARDIMLVERLYGKKIDEVDMDVFLAAIEEKSFKHRWKRIAVGLEKEIYKLYADGVYGDLRAVTYEGVYRFLEETKPHVLQPSHYDRLSHRLSTKVGGLTGKAMKKMATVSTEKVNFLLMADPDDFIASMNWRTFMVDFLTVVAWEGMYGVRSKGLHSRVVGDREDGIGHLMATNKFPYWNPEHSQVLLGQVYAHQVSGQGSYALIFQMLKKVEESNYRPMEELLVGGRENPQGIWAGMADLGLNSLDLRNTDYGGKFKNSFWVTVGMMQATFIWMLFSRTLLVGVSPRRVPVMWAFSSMWAMWAFAWPWIVLYATEGLRETKSGTRNGLFLQAKVRLKVALDHGNTEDIQQDYDKLIEVYRNFRVGPPQVLIDQVKQVEDDLQVHDENRLSAQDILPYMALLVQMKDASMVDKRAIYHRITGIIDAGDTWNIGAEEADLLLQFLLLNPPFISKLNPVVHYSGILAVAIITTWLASPFDRKTYGKATKNLGTAIPWVVAGIGLYGLTWLLLQKEHVRKIWDLVAEDILGYPESRHKEDY